MKTRDQGFISRPFAASGRNGTEWTMPALARSSRTSCAGRGARVRSGQLVRVLYVINSLEMGGGERVVVDLVNGLDPGKFDAAVCCLQRSGPCAGLIRRKDVDVIEMHRGEGNDYSLPFKLSQLIRNRGIDVIHSNGWGTFCEAVTAARLGGGIVAVHTDHGRVAEDFSRLGAGARWKRKIRHRVQRFLSRWVDRVVAVSDVLKEQLIDEMGFEPSKVMTLVNGISIPEGTPDREGKRRELGLSKDMLVICSVGRLATIKNYPLLLSAASHVIREFPEVRFIVAGDGPERGALEDLQRQLGLESVVTFLGYREDIPELFAASDLFVLTSDFEATSMALLEAMGAGLPVIATRVGGNPFLLSDQETGFLVPPRDAAALSKQIIALLRNPVLRQQMGMKGAERARTLFSRERMLKEHERLYLRLLEEKERLKCEDLEKAPVR